MKKWFRRSLQNQLTVFMLLAVLLPICLLGLFYYFSAVNLSKERATISGQSSLQQLEETLEFIVNDVNNMSLFLIGNEDVQSYLKKDQASVQQRRDIYGVLSNLTLSKPYMANILIEPLNGNPEVSTIPILTTERDLSSYRTGNKWWSSLYNNKTSIESQDVISMYRPIRSTYDYHLIGHLSIILKQRAIEDYLQSIEFEWDGTVLLMDKGSVLALAGKYNDLGGDEEIKKLYSLVNGDATEQAFTYQINGKKSTILSTTLPDVGWNLIGIIPFEEYSAQNRYFLFLTIISVVVAVLLVSGFVLFFVRKVVGPLSILTKALRSSSPSEGMEELPLHSNDEVGQLVVSYNRLNSRIQSLMGHIKKNESNKRKVDLQALQAQINPHFLYNTLASVHWMALVVNQKNISEMVSSLSTFLRFSLNKGSEYCTVEQELSHLENYVNIQKIRYPGEFRLEINMPEDVKQLYILKLVLQPLVENSIIHGVLPAGDQRGVIKVEGEWDQTNLYVTVSDNGVSISDKQVKQLHEHFSTDENGEVVVGENYGLRNVNLRLLLHYGSNARLHITSDPNNGTTIRTIIPLERR